MYKISREKFEFDINSIIELEKFWVGHEALGFNHFTNKYEWGTITRRNLNSRQFEIKWLDQKRSIHSAYFLFISKSKKFDDFNSKKKVNFFKGEFYLNDYDRNNSKITEKILINTKENSQLMIRNNNQKKFEKNFQINRDRSTPIIDANETVGFSILDNE